MLLLILASIIVGFIIGATGVGGVLLIPALMIFGGMETHQAMATSLGSFFFTGIVSTWIYQRYGSFQWGTTLPVLVGSLLSGYAGAHAAAYIQARHLDMLLSIVIILPSFYSLFSRKGTSLASRLKKRGNMALLVGIGLFTGFICGMTGAGGGIVSTPIMLLCGYELLPAITTAQILQVAISLSGSVSNLEKNFIVFPAVWWISLAEIAGVVLGVRLAHVLSLWKLKKIVVALCILIGFGIIGRSLYL